MAVQFADNVTICFNRTIKMILAAAVAAHTKVLGPERDVVVTGGLEGKHRAESGHYYNRSLDFRTGHTWPLPYLTREQAIAIRIEMQEHLGPGFLVLLEEEPPHLHAQKHAASEPAAAVAVACALLVLALSPQPSALSTAQDLQTLPPCRGGEIGFWQPLVDADRKKVGMVLTWRDVLRPDAVLCRLGATQRVQALAPEVEL